MSSRTEFMVSDAIAIDDRFRPTLQRQAWTRLNAFVERNFFVVAITLALLSTVAMTHALGSHMGGDVRAYRDVSHDLLIGKLPYRDRTLEYPPYSVLVFLLPRVVVDSEHYLSGFMVLSLLADAVLKGFLIRAGRVSGDGVRALGPVALYSLAVPFLQHLYLQRFDIWPAMLTIALAMMFSRRKCLTSGILLSAGVFLKVYPVVFGPALLLGAMRQRKLPRFISGLAAGLLPVALLSMELPWWRFAFFQANRGLEAESIYASIIWLGKLMSWWPATWGHVIAWMEVLGPVAAQVVPWARLLWVVTTLVSGAVAAARLWREPNMSLGQLARVLLLPLLAFVVFNPVFSPQFMIWLLALAALGTLEGSLWVPLAVLFCAMITPIVCPSLFHDFSRGLGLFETVVMVLRNIVLAGAWIGLMAAEKAGVEVEPLSTSSRMAA
jgi:hypothetical protein